ncbi:MAG: Panacea domain-containing protein [Bacteroidota bacterium]
MRAKDKRLHILLKVLRIGSTALAHWLTLHNFLRIFVDTDISNYYKMVGFKYKKSVQALNFFAQQEGGKINKMKALKLLWLSDRAHLWKHARPITDDTYFAMKFGPVASGSKDLIEESDFIESQTEKDYTNKYLKRLDNLQYSSTGEIDDSVLSRSEIEALTIVYGEFGKMSQFDLSDLSHIFPEWKKYESEIKAGGVRYEMKLVDFFDAPLKDFNVFKKLSENAKLAKEIFIQNASISNF